MAALLQGNWLRDVLIPVSLLATASLVAFVTRDQLTLFGLVVALYLVVLAVAIFFGRRVGVEKDLRAQAEQQEAVASLGQRALAGASLAALLDDAVATVVQVLRLEVCSVAELQSGGDSFLLRAGVGWPPGLVGRQVLPAAAGSQSGYTLLAGVPVIVEDFRTEQRFSAASPLAELRVVSGISVPITGARGPFGVLSGQSRKRRRFSGNDVNFLVGVANVLELVVERKAALEATEQLAAIVETSTEAVLTVNVEGRILNSNVAAQRLYGYTAEELLNADLAKVCPPAAAVAMRDVIARLARGETVAGFETERLTKSGRVLDVSIAVSALRNEGGQITGIASIARDVTDQKRAERQWRQNADKLEVIVKNVPVILFATDVEGRITLFEGRGLEAFGSEPETEIGPLLQRERWNDRISRELRAGNATNTTIEAGDRVFEVYLSPANGPDGMSGMIGVAIDVTEARKAEDLRVELLAAEESSRVATNLLSTVSHELRTPLTAVRGFASTILDYGDRLSEEEKASYVRAIEDAARHLETMVSDLLTLSRIDAGALHLELEPVSVLSLVQTALSAFGVAAASHDLRVASPDDLLFVHGDVSRLRQVLTNLVDNAIKYSPNTGEIEISVRETNAEVQITVRDHGAGVPPEALEAIFDTFYRVRSPETAGVKGSGLGLAICRGIVRAHGGRIWAAIPEGGGLAVTFSLPRLALPELRAST